MRFLAILNRDGGTLRTTDLDALCASMGEVLGKHGHELRIEIVPGKDVVTALEKAATDTDVDVVLAGGGDGTVSAAATHLMNGDKALAVLPAGTMNLFARGLGIPLSLPEAIEAFAAGRERRVDIATANGRPFIHQFSIGLHARLVQLRSRFEYGSRWGKMVASIRAGIAAISNPSSMDVWLEMDGERVLTRTTGIGVSNNVFGDGHLPYADAPDGGILGVYVAKAANRFDLARVFLAISVGRWRSTDKVETYQARSVLVKMASPVKRRPCVIDGELSVLEPETTIEIHPGTLRVLVPAGTD